ncbi:hypothetical protein FOL47_004237, partial [Perkinsus chesapeaki]
VYVDCNCCNGRLKTAAPVTGGGEGEAGTRSSGWESRITKKLDIMHLLMRIGREMNAEHVRRAYFLKQLSRAVFTESLADTERLEEIRKKAGLALTPEQKRIDRYRYVRRAIGDPQTICAKVLLVTKAHIALDIEASNQCQKAGMPIDNITPASPAYPLITAKVKKVIFNQCVHLLNGCVSDCCTSYVAVGERDYRSTGEKVMEYRSLRGTSKELQDRDLRRESDVGHNQLQQEEALGNRQ